jgi:hypothetical protein
VVVFAMLSILESVQCDSQPSDPQPNVTQPSDPQPNVTQPVSQPNVTQPSDPQPNVTQPSDPQPNVTQPVFEKEQRSDHLKLEIIIISAIVMMFCMAICIYVLRNYVLLQDRCKRISCQCIFSVKINPVIIIEQPVIEIINLPLY